MWPPCSRAALLVTTIWQEKHAGTFGEAGACHPCDSRWYRLFCKLSWDTLRHLSRHRGITRRITAWHSSAQHSPAQHTTQSCYWRHRQPCWYPAMQHCLKLENSFKRLSVATFSRCTAASPHQIVELLGTPWLVGRSRAPGIQHQVTQPYQPFQICQDSQCAHLALACC